MVKRNWYPPEMKAAFFEVKKLPLYFKTPQGKECRAKNYYGILDVSKGTILSAVSGDYKIISNLDAYYGADQIVREVFRDIRLEDMEFFNLYLPETRSFMHLDLIRPGRKISPFDDDPWTAFLRITNSYNRLHSLSYEIGFCRWICQNGMIYDSKSIKFSVNHCGRIDLNDLYLRRHLGQIHDIESRFSLRLREMRDFSLSPESIPQIFFTVFPMLSGHDYDKLSSKQTERVLQRKRQVEELAKSYTEEMGCNAYAMLNILTDFASYPDPEKDRRGPLSGVYQKRIGVWMDEFYRDVIKNRKPVSEYVSPDALATVNFEVKKPR